MFKEVFNLKNKWVRRLAKVTIFVYLFSLIYAAFFTLGWSETYDFESKTYSHPESGCYVTNDQWAVFVTCNEDNLAFLEPILSSPFYLLGMTVIAPAFFIYETELMITEDHQSEPDIWLLLFLITITVVYLSILVLKYIWILLKSYFSKKTTEVQS